MSEKPPLYKLTPLPKQAKESADGQITMSYQIQLADEEIAAIKRQEAERILTAFSIEAAALTMFHTDGSLHWAVGELDKAMRAICGIDKIQETCEHAWKKVGSNNSLQTLKVTSWIYYCEKCKGYKDEVE